ncbi:MAG TPA: SIS domain-containing protein [Acidocella sp.]|nr:MAG: phosphoheptose isomerase [Rhodospirillales bacterium 20-64-7]HQT46613.1 SIS domain-containing protein [Acidocella sp.]
MTAAGGPAVAVLRRNLHRTELAMRALGEDRPLLAQFEAMAGVLLTCFRRGGRLYIAGNGGSAAEAQHIAGEFVSRLAYDRAPLPAEALNVDGALLTAIGNDYGFDQVFARQLAGKLTDRDVFLGFTSSGNSPNILEALQLCRGRGLPGLALAGRDGGGAAGLASICLVAPGETTSAIQEMHMILAHALCESVERAMFPQQTPPATPGPAL